MPVLAMSGLTFDAGIAWVDRALVEAVGLLGQGGWVNAVENLADVLVLPSSGGPARRLLLPEPVERFSAAALLEIECVYRFCDRVILRGRRQ